MSWLLMSVSIAAFIPPLLSFLVHWSSHGRANRYGFWIFAASVYTFEDVLFAFSGLSWIPVCVAAGNLVLGIILWWRNRRKRKSVLGLIGNKSRALVARLVRKMRPSRRPVLRPVPA